MMRIYVILKQPGPAACASRGRWGGWDGRTAEMKVYDKWHKPPDDARLVDYDSFEELAGKYLKTQLVLREAFELLEKHMPPWYLRKHYNRIVEVLEDVED